MTSHSNPTLRALGWVLALVASVMLPGSLRGQVALDEATMVEVALEDGTVVTLMGAAPGLEGRRMGGVAYYYLPTNLRLSSGPDDRPQFLFLKYNTESGEVQGGVLHFLMEWGLTDAQVAEAQEKLEEACSRSVVRRAYRPGGLRGMSGAMAGNLGGFGSFNQERQAVLAEMAEQRGVLGIPPRGLRSWVRGLPLLMGPPPCGTIRGAARVSTDAEGESFRVISATLTSEDRTRSLVSSGKAPVLPGSRIAVAADLDAYGAQLLAAPFERDLPIADLSVELDLSFTAMVPAGEGRIVLHWDRLHAQRDSLVREWNKKKQTVEAAPGKFCLLPLFCRPRDERTRVRPVATDIEIREEYEFLIENEIIELDFVESVEDERLTAVREAFFNYFISAFAEPVPASEMAELRQPGSESEELTINRRKKRFYRSKESTYVQDMQRKQEFRLDYQLAYSRPFTVVQNVKSWYDDVQANYPEAIAAVNLNDPFFNNRTVRFRLDFDAPQELFTRTEDRSGAINYVTVRMRKTRSGENDFEDDVTIDEAYIAEHGLFAEMTFADGGSSDAGQFDYMTQWSYGGGQLYPESPRWQSAATPAVTLVPPVSPRTLEIEGDLAAMDASDISRITVQVVYQKFGQAVLENIPLSPALGQPLVARTLFMDRDQNGYVYRLVVNHKSAGRMATEWSPKVNDNYVYAAVPADLLQDPVMRDEARAAAADASSATSSKDAVLDRFRSVLSGGR